MEINAGWTMDMGLGQPWKLGMGIVFTWNLVKIRFLKFSYGKYMITIEMGAGYPWK